MKQTQLRINILTNSSLMNLAVNELKRTLILYILATAFAGFCLGRVAAQTSVDSTFNPQIQTNLIGSKTVTSIIPLSGGKILVGGDFNSYNRQSTGKLVRLNSDGTLDSTFKNTNLSNAKNVSQIYVQTDGKILVRGFNLTISSSNLIPQIVRFNSNGDLDTGFNINQSLLSSIKDMMTDGNGRIILSGSFNLGNNQYVEIVRLNSDGSLDISFQFTETGVSSVAVQSNKIITCVSVGSNYFVRRFNQDGTSDSSFVEKNLNATGARFLIVQPDSKILVAGTTFLIRLNANGGDDANFNIINFPQTIRQISVEGSGKIVTVSGFLTQKFLQSGLPDNSFTNYMSPNISTIGVQSDGSIVVGDVLVGTVGTSIPNDFLRLLPTGIPDSSFNTGIGFQQFLSGWIRAISVQPDNKILVGGKFDLVNGNVVYKLARLNSDAGLDSTFQINTGGNGNYFSRLNDIYTISLQNDGKILVSGEFRYFVNGMLKENFVRLNSDGSIDSTFNLSIALQDYFGCCSGGFNKSQILDNGKILIAASRLSLPNPVPIKVNSDGSIDNSFTSAVFPQSNTVYAMDMFIQTGGKIVLSGRYINSSSIQSSFIVRLSENGSIDTTFQYSEENGKEVSRLSLLPDNKILIVKNNLVDNVTQQGKIQRIFSNGSIDNSFNEITTNGKINAIHVLENGNFFIGGKFSTVNGVTRTNLAQANSDGNLSPINYDLNDEVLSLTADRQGRVLIGGSFTVINVGSSEAGRSYLARLNDSPQTSRKTRFDFDGDSRADLGTFNTQTGVWRIMNSNSNQSASVHFGFGIDKFAPADYDGDGKADITVYRPSEGIWYMLKSRDGFGAIRWGAREDRPVAADYDGDGKADVAVWRPSNGSWYILRTSDNQMQSVHFGLSTDIPLIDADFDGDGKADVAVWRPSNGFFYWLSSGSNNQFRAIQFGQLGDIPTVGDYNGDGKTDLAVFRNDGNWYQYLTTANGEYLFSATKFGQNGDEPVPADYDGDGKSDVAVRRGNVWYLMKSSQGFTGVVFADANDTAIAASAAQ